MTRYGRAHISSRALIKGEMTIGELQVLSTNGCDPPAELLIEANSAVLQTLNPFWSPKTAAGKTASSMLKQHVPYITATLSSLKSNV